MIETLLIPEGYLPIWASLAITIHYNSVLARRRFFVNAIRGGTAEIVGEDARHLTRVLRVEAGQRFEISDNRAAWLPK
jgi:hypothetical protein